jgi:hypothetical protein
MLHKPTERVIAHNPDLYFQALHTKLASEFHLCTMVFNAPAERPIWQSRFFLVLSGEAIFIDLLEGKGEKKPSHVVVHNRDWHESVTQASLNYINGLLVTTDAPFLIKKGIRHGG